MNPSPLLALLLVGCANTPYWTRTHEPQEVKLIRYVDVPCGMRNTRGCWNDKTLTIEVQKGLTTQQELCVIRHEAAHAKGYTHPANMAFEWDCGP